MKEIKVNSIITFKYKNCKGLTSTRSCVVEGIFYGRNALDKEEQFILNGFDLEKNKAYVYEIKNISDLRFNSWNEFKYKILPRL